MYVGYLRSAALPHDGDKRWSKSQRLLETAFQQYTLLECIVVRVLGQVFADMTALLLIARTLSTHRHSTQLHTATSTLSTDRHSTHGSTRQPAHTHTSSHSASLTPFPQTDIIGAMVIV